MGLACSGRIVSDAAMLKTPYADLLPPLSTEEFEALKADIKANGMLHPILVDEDRNILDGFHRYRIDKNAKRKVIRGLTEDEKQAFVIRANLTRRNLSPAQKAELRKRQKEIAFRLREADKRKWTQAAVAKVLGISRECVTKWFSPNGKSTKTSNPDARVKVEPKQKPVIAQRVKKGESQSQVAADYGVSQKQVSRIVTEVTKLAETRKQRQKAAKKRKGNNGIIRGDFRNAKDATESFDLIFTDPPYNDVQAYADLAEYAARTLCKGGWLLAYSGKSHLLNVFNAMELSVDAKQLVYAWTFCVLHSEGDARFRKFKLYTGWKPILAFYKPPLSVDWDWFKDTVSGGREKSDHEWQQAQAEAEHFIQRLCPVKGIVCDPFAGSGTTLVAAKALGRRWLGYEIDKGYVETARSRLD